MSSSSSKRNRSVLKVSPLRSTCNSVEAGKSSPAVVTEERRMSFGPVVVIVTGRSVVVVVGWCKVLVIVGRGSVWLVVLEVAVVE